MSDKCFRFLRTYVKMEPHWLIHRQNVMFGLPTQTPLHCHACLTYLEPNDSLLSVWWLVRLESYGNGDWPARAVREPPAASCLQMLSGSCTSETVHLMNIFSKAPLSWAMSVPIIFVQGCILAWQSNPICHFSHSIMSFIAMLWVQIHCNSTLQHFRSIRHSNKVKTGKIKLLILVMWNKQDPRDRF